MVDRYTEKALRIIFFAREEANMDHSLYVETGHLLLGLLRENKDIARRFGVSIEATRGQINANQNLKEVILNSSHDLPLSDECKQVLRYAGEEAESLTHKFIGSEHLLLGLLRKENCQGAQLLRHRGISLESIRSSIAKSSGVHRRNDLRGYGC
jgi:ATP-dependent Clp protease ATP-binding subunit ClpC